MQNRQTFLIVFAVTCFVAKIISEFVHEVCGHGIPVLLFGGRITNVHISILWPYELSYISWTSLNTFTPAQSAWIYAGGILACLCTSFLVQAVLFLKKKKTIPYLVIGFFWFAFWTLVNSTGYLMIGGLAPFGDVYELIRLDVLTAFVSLGLGIVLFAAGFFGLSWILRGILLEEFPLRKASWGVSLFWLIIPVLGTLMLASPERDFQISYLPLMFIPSLLSLVLEYLLILSKQQIDTDPDDIAKE